MAWRVFAAAAIGASHLQENIPCQDAFAQTTVGDTLVAVVCDGAGSQPLSHLGSARLSADVVAALAQRVGADANFAHQARELIEPVIAEVVANARAALEAMAAEAGTEIGAYSATLVGAVANAQGGWFFQVGDGLAIAETADTSLAPSLSLPENGEYANETYFVSGEAWREHLRFTAIAPASTCIALMSDGAMPFVMAKGHLGFFRPFMDPVTRFLAGTETEAQGSAALASTLGDARTHTITGDDKTLLVALWT